MLFRSGASAFFDRIQVFKRAASLGGVDSLVSLPVLTSQYGFSDQQLADAGVTKGMVRLSVGIEHIDDLIADLQVKTWLPNGCSGKSCKKEKKMNEIKPEVSIHLDELKKE